MTDAARGEGTSWSPERSAAGGHNPYLIAFVVSIATFMEVLDTTIANVALRHIAGSLAVGIDESTYIITSYLVANAIVLSISGWIADTYTWHWVFLINVPMGLISLFLVGTLVNEPSSAEVERERLLKSGLRMDYIGFVLVAVGLGSLEFVLDEGQRKDWFGSNMILSFALLAGASLAALVPWELTREDPIVDLSLLGQRQFGACFLVMLATGAVLIA